MTAEKTRKRKANAQVAGGGGGGGGWAEHNRKQAERAAARQKNATPYGALGAEDDTSQRIALAGPGGQTGTSIFDPVLCEIAYRWFSAPGAQVLDPFAGGSVRGIVAALCGREYLGIDLRPEQIEANQAQSKTICRNGIMPQWICGDSSIVLGNGSASVDADLIFSCPPYGDLEVYSDDPADLSRMEFADFLASYRAIIALAVARLKEDRFACFVVGDFRDTKGFYRNFVGETVAAFEAAGARLYNEAVLVTAVGSLPIRAGKQFASTRKLGKTHQNILVFCKGDPRKATEACGEVEIPAEFFHEDLPEPGVDNSSPAAGDQFGTIL